MSAITRILLKLSGEALMGADAFGYNAETMAGIVGQIKEVVEMGTEVGIVVGGGNLFRGATGALSGMDRATADSMGMLATVMNALALKDALVAAGIEARVQTAVTIAHVGEAFRAGQRGAASGSRTRGDLRGRHRQPLLHHRYRLGPARRRDRRRPDAQGHQGGRRLHGRSQEGPDGHPLRDA
jgi:hypothetical protein